MIHGKTGQPQLGRTCIRATFKIADTLFTHAPDEVHMTDLKDGSGDAEIETTEQNQELIAHSLVATLITAMRAARKGGTTTQEREPPTERPSNLLRHDLGAPDRTASAKV